MNVRNLPTIKGNKRVWGAKSGGKVYGDHMTSSRVGTHQSWSEQEMDTQMDRCREVVMVGRVGREWL